MNRDELFEHLLSDPYHSKNRITWFKELQRKGWWEPIGKSRFTSKKTLYQGTLKARSFHESDHSHPDHEHGDSDD